MSSAPRLTAPDIVREVERIFAKPRRAPLVALYGTGPEAKVSARGLEWEVIPTRSEIDLRSRMPMPGELDDKTGPGRVYLLDWTERPLPLDLSCRFAAGRVFQISRDSRLAAVFGARQAEARLVGSGLSKVLLSGDVTGLKKVSGLTLKRDDAYRRFMDAWLKFDLGAPLDAAGVIAWCAENDLGPGLVAKGNSSEAWRELADELRSFVSAKAGPMAELAWRAWEQQLGDRFLQLALLVHAHSTHGDPVAGGLLEGRLPDLGPTFGAALFQSRSRVTDELLKGTIERLGDDARRRTVREADALIEQRSFASTRRASIWLPAGHEAREEALGTRLGELVKAPKPDRLHAVIEALAAVRAHQLDKELRSTEQRETRRMAVRLACYLVDRKQRPGPPELGPNYGPAVELAQAFVREGGFVDWCRQRLRGPLPFAEGLTKGAHKVLGAVDAARREDNRAFAAGLAAWLDAGKPSDRVLPIERVTSDLVLRLLQGAEQRKILIVLMDGMSWANTVQLLTRLETEKWAPIVWRPPGHAAAMHLPPVLASAPTLTPVSRASFFAGKWDKRSGDKGTGQDVNRWRENAHLLKANDDAAMPDLVLRGKLMTGDRLDDDVREAIDSDDRVVGVVVNAIDEDLKGSGQTLLDYSQNAIKPLTGLITAAAGAERIVLLASDHGHAPGAAMDNRPKPSKSNAGSKRWRALGPDDEAKDYELRLPGASWKPKGAQGVAAIWDEGISHGHPAYGEHGGVSLAEVVAPAVLIAPDWLTEIQSEDADSLATRPFPRPSWWLLRLGSAMPARKVAAAPAEPEDRQLALIAAPPKPRKKAAAKAPVAERPELVKKLEQSKVFKAHVEGQSDRAIKQVLDCLAVLLDGGDRMGEDEFARAYQVLPFKVPSLVSRMGMLNIDGFAIVEHDRSAKQIALHRSRLVQQYGLSE